MGPCHIDPPGNELSYLRIYALTYMGAERGVNTARESQSNSLVRSQ
jgi:hypothetical protein